MKRIEAKNKKRPHKKTGPKREFNEFQLQVVRDVVGKFGGTQNDLAMLFGKNRSTIEYWVKNYANFRQAYQNGKLERGVEYARKLDHLAMGYSHKDTKFFKMPRREYDQDGNIIAETVRIVPVEYIKHYPPDRQAIIKLLSILHSSKGWSETTKVDASVTHYGEIQVRNISELDLKALSEEHQRMLFEVGMKQLQEGVTNN